MNIVDYYGNLASEVATKCEETRDQFIFQVLSDYALTNYQIEIDKEELIAAIMLIRKARGADIPLKDPKIRLGYMAGYDDGKIDAEKRQNITCPECGRKMILEVIR